MARKDKDKFVAKPPEDERGRIARSDLRTESVGRKHGSFGPLWNRHKKYLSVLPLASDNVAAELGLDVLDRMMNDPQVSASIYNLVYQAFVRGIAVRPRYNDPSHPYYKAGVEMYDFISYNLDFCNDAMEDVDVGLMQELESEAVNRLVYGNALSEWTGVVATHGPLANKLCLSSLRTKPPDVYGYVSDPYGAVRGIACYTGKGGTAFTDMTEVRRVGGDWEVSADNLPAGWEILPVSKFLVTRHRPRSGDPRGTSALSSAYNSWFLLMNLWPDYHKYLTQFASPSMLGVLGEKDIPRYNAHTKAEDDPLDELYELLEDFQNSTVIAVRHGVEVKPLQAHGDGYTYGRAIETLNHQIIKAIQHSVLGTEMARNQTRAASTVHKDVQDLPAHAIKRVTVDAFQRQVWRRLIHLNFGKEAADLLTPMATLGSIAPEDKIESLKGFAAAGYKILPSQFRDVSNEIELDPATPEEIEAEFRNMSGGEKVSKEFEQEEEA